jgi:hypothetical protein
MYAGATEMYELGQGGQGESLMTYLTNLKNPIATCASDVLGYLNSNHPTLADSASSAISAGSDCKKAFELFEETSDDGRVAQEADATLRHRFLTFGRNAAKESSFWEDLARGVLTGLEHLHG